MPMTCAEKSLTELLTERSCKFPDRTAYLIIGDGQDADRPVSYRELETYVASLVNTLSGKGLEGKIAILLYQDILEFIISFLACQYLGIIPVPLPYTKRGRQQAKWNAVILDTQASVIFCTSHSTGDLEQWLADHSFPEKLEIVATDLRAPASKHDAGPPPSCNEIAFIQYTSGSTGDPRGVVVTHKSLLHNQQLIKDTFGCSEGSVIFSWLPFHHDMGLIGNILQTIYSGCTCLLMSPFHFIQSPKRWLEYISRYKVTHSGGPNFAYDLCADRISREDLHQFDLSSWQVAYNGSEPVRLDTLQRFAAYFQPAGFDPQRFYPCYGLAEATLLVSGHKKDPSVTSLCIIRGLISDGKIRLTDRTDPLAENIVSAGKVAPGMDVKIISLSDQHECGELEEGEVCISGESVTRGYWNRDNAAYFHTIGEKRFLRTGDTGFMYQGELFIHGRHKEMLIIRGQNFYPYDIEQAIAGNCPEIEANGVAVFSTGDKEERLVAVAEIKRASLKGLDIEKVLHAIDSTVNTLCDVNPYDIVLTTPMGIPRTTSGKLKRTKCRDSYQNNAFVILSSKLKEAHGHERKKRDTFLPSRVLQEGGNDRIREYILDIIASLLGSRPKAVAGINTDLREMGLDSLRMTELINVLNKELGVDIDIVKMLAGSGLDELTGLVAHALTDRRIRDREILSSVPFTRSMPAADYPLSDGQRGIYLLSRLEGGCAAYNITTGFYWEGPLDVACLKKAFSLSISRHEILRTVFRDKEGEPRQVVLEDIPFTLEVEDLSRDTDVKRSILEESGRYIQWAFDLENGPLVKAKLLRLAGEEHALILGMHHIISDGWSMAVWLQQLLDLYRSLSRAELPDLHWQGIQYRDYVCWMKERTDGPWGQKSEAFWKAWFREMPVQLDLPLDYQRGALRSFNGTVIKHRLEEALEQQMQAFCREHKVSLFNFLHAVIAILLHKLSLQDDMVIGVPASGRTHFDLHHAPGLFANALPSRVRVRKNESFLQLVKEWTDDFLHMMEFQDYPLERILEAINVRPDPSRHPLFDVMLVLQDTRSEFRSAAIRQKYDIGLHSLDSYLYDRSPILRTGIYVKSDLCFNFNKELDGRLCVEIEFPDRLFTPDTIDRWYACLLSIIANVIERPQMRIADIDMVSAAQKHQLLHDFNATGQPFTNEGTIAGLFGQQAAATPDDVALVAGEKEFTYQKVDQRANQLAHYLRETYALRPDDLIGVKLHRDEWLVITLLAVLKSGAAYVPIDPDYPAERISYMLTDSNCKALVDEKELRRFRANERKYPGSDPVPVNGPGDLAYVIYTSGSTGIPKGVMIEQRNACAFIHWCKEEFRHADFDMVYAATSICFDLSIFEIFYSLCQGKKVRILKNALWIEHYLKRDRKVLLNTVPGVVGALLAGEADLSAVNVINMAGEPVPAKYVAALDKERMEIRNLYGPTEYTTYSTVYRMKDTWPILIGRPIANTRIYILDEDYHLCPVGVPGEIYIGGDGLARGYLNRSALTAERFVADPFAGGQRMYKTGDLGRWMPGGDIEYIGRKDNQVKIRGHRIEPGEIEYVLEKYPGIDLAAVICRKNKQGENELIAYVNEHPSLQIHDLRVFLSNTLPGYMIPGRLVQLTAFPLTPNGKIDRKRLPEPDDESAYANGTSYIPPRSMTEEQLAAIWQEVLGRERIGVLDDFFDLGGHSLQTMRLASHISRVFDVQLPLNQLFLNTVLEKQARLILTAGTTKFTPIIPAGEQPFYPLSPSQRRMLVLTQFEEASAAYHMPAAFILEGCLDVGALRRAFDTLIARHEILRTVFREGPDGEMGQVILGIGETGFELGYVDMRGEGAVSWQKTAERELLRAFDLANDPLLRACLLQTKDTEWVLTFVIHHIISDGWSIQVLVRELVFGYNSFAGSGDISLPSPDIHYKDYAVWLQQQLKNEYHDHELYWIGQLSGELPVMDLPGDKPRPAVKAYHGSVVNRDLGLTAGEGLRAICREQDCTLFMGLLTAVSVLLYRYTGARDMIVGTPVACREHIDLKDQIGLYVNTLPIRIRIDGQNSFLALLHHVRRVCLEAYDHQSYPFDELVNALQLPSDSSRNPLFEVMAVWDEDVASLFSHHRLTGLNITHYPQVIDTGSKFDLSFHFSGNGDQLNIGIEYNCDIYHESTVWQMAQHLESIVSAALSFPALPINELDYMGSPEKDLLSGLLNDTTIPYPAEKSIIDLFEDQVRSTPYHPAILFGDMVMSYDELNKVSNRLGHFLRENYLLGANDLAGVKLERSQWLIIAILGVLKTGGAYLPLDPEYPAERIQYMVTDSRCKVVIDEEVLQAFMKGQDKYGIADLPRQHDPQDLVYVIYTSGSTGRPKGAMVLQHSFVNLNAWYGNMLDVHASDCCLLMAPVSFDLAQKNIFTPLVNGAKLCVPPRIFGDYATLAAIIEREQVSIVNAAPSAFYPLLDREINGGYEKLASLRKIVLGGEPIRLSEFRQWIASGFYNCTLINSYGPTECTDVVSAYTVDNGIGEKLTAIPIGKPVQNCRLYILDERLRLVPRGMIGEIFIAGVCIGAGYLGDAPMTAEKFLPDPFNDGGIMYRTGDLGRWRADGEMEFIGRKDQQVKIRGHRIEPGEIEAVLLSYPGISAAVVIPSSRPDGEQELIAYIVAASDVPMNEISEHVSRALPPHMTPSGFVRLEEMPLTPSGKVDRKSLSLYKEAEFVRFISFIAPRNIWEDQLVNIWRKVLGKETIGVKDNFFHLGGHSLKITRLAGEILRQLHVKPSFRDLFFHPVLEQQALLVWQLKRTPVPPLLPAAVMESHPLSPSQRRLWVLCQFQHGSSAYNIAGVYRFKGSLDMAAMQRAIEALIQRHESLRTAFREDSLGEIRQFILPAGTTVCDIVVKDLRGEPDAVAMLQVSVREECARVFDLTSGVLLRANAFRLSETRWTFTFVVHHIVSDGWSMGVLINEMSELYNSFATGRQPSLSPMGIHYKDYTHWLSLRFVQPDFEEHRKFWLDQFSGDLPVLALPGDKARPAVKSYSGAAFTKVIGGGTLKKAKAIFETRGATLFMGLLATLSAVLNKYTAQTDIIIGTPIAGRDHPDLESQIGIYINTLALRLRWSAENSFNELLDIVRTTVLHAHEHREFPFDELVEALDLKRDLSRSALFDIMMLLENEDIENAGKKHWYEMEVGPYEGSVTSSAKFDITFLFREMSDQLVLEVEYNTDIYRKDTLVRLADNFEELLSAVTSDPSLPLCQVDCLSERERQLLLLAFNDTFADYPQDVTIIDLFDRQVVRSPEDIAVACKDTTLTYKELDEHSSRLAGYLRRHYTVASGQLVGIRLQRNEWLIISMLAVLKAGGAYVPIDPEYPEERKAYILQDSRCKLLIDEAELEKFRQLPDQPEMPAGNVNKAGDLAYVIYTSGSTGNPKGVMITHGNVNAFIHWCIREFHRSEAHVIFAVTSVCFDLSIFEIFYTLCAGKKIRLLPSALAIPDYLHKEQNILLNTVPSVVGVLLQENADLSRVKVLNMAGEPVPDNYLRQLDCSTIEVRNLYGPSEDTTYSTVYRMSNSSPILIGKPISNTEVFILDGNNNLQPIGVYGEIHLAGHGLSKGYLHQPDLTGEKFICHPLASSGRMYKTGDIGRWLADGNIEFAGRVDDQVKIRGHRIEPGEIERSLLSLGSIDGALVAAHGSHGRDKYLVAYITGEKNINIDQARSYLQQRLPAYMIPARIIQLNEFPRTPNGKIDRKRLPVPDDLYTAQGTVHIPPGNETEEKLAVIWQSVLGKSRVGIKDNFFELGGHSLKAAQLISRINREFSVRIDIEDIFKEPTIERIAAQIQFLHYQRGQEQDMEKLVQIEI